MHARSAYAFLPVTLLALAGCYNPGDLGDKPFFCNPQYPECPSGYFCDLDNCPPGRGKCDCVREGQSSTALTIPKNGRVYNGPHLDPGLNTCHEEGHYTIASPFVVGDSTGPFDGLEICPPGNRDVFSLNVNAGESVMVKIKYQIVYGDLDLGMFDVNGMLIPSAADADASHDDACVVLPRGASSGTYFAVVQGAEGAVNRYKFQMFKSSTPLSCSPAPPVDMAM